MTENRRNHNRDLVYDLLAYLLDLIEGIEDEIAEELDKAPYTIDDKGGYHYVQSEETDTLRFYQNQIHTFERKCRALSEESNNLLER